MAGRVVLDEHETLEGGRNVKSDLGRAIKSDFGGVTGDALEQSPGSALDDAIS
jgi:hypothetical protein